MSEPHPPGPGDSPSPPPVPTFPPYDAPPAPAFPPVEAYQPPPGQAYQPPPEYTYQPPAGYPDYPPPPAYQTPMEQAYPPQYGGYYPYPATPVTDGLAIGSMVVSFVAVAGLCFYGLGGLLGIVAAILGHVARRRIRQTGAAGEGMALTGIIVGWVAAGTALITVVGLFAYAVSTN